MNRSLFIFTMLFTGLTYAQDCTESRIAWPVCPTWFLSEDIDSVTDGFYGKIQGSLFLQPPPSMDSVGPVVDRFAGGWYARSVNLRSANEWYAVPPFLGADLGWRKHAKKSYRMHLKIGLNVHRDIAAWLDDPPGWNAPLGLIRELDINQPRLGYLHFESKLFDFDLGRFKVHWSPSPVFGLALSQSTPFHDGFRAGLNMGALKFQWLVSSFNPWLTGTPPAGNLQFPDSSEEARQRKVFEAYTNSHRRIYDAPQKTLFAHRLTFTGKNFQTGITELVMIGGKPPSLRDGSPFIFFHNNFDHGYSNVAVSLEFRVSPNKTMDFFTEFFMDDINFSQTETENDSPTLWGLMLGAEHEKSWGEFETTTGLHWVKINPLVYNYWTPLNRLYSRQVVRSNYDRLGEPGFTDTYILDLPLGYLRGANTQDFWVFLTMRWRKKHLVHLKLGWLQKGVSGPFVPFESYLDPGWEKISRKMNTDIRLRCSYRWKITPVFEVITGVQWESKEDSGELWDLHGGIFWSWP